MSDNHIADKSESAGSMNRRQFVKRLAVAGGVAAFGSMGAGASSAEFDTKAVSQAKAGRVFAVEATGVLETLDRVKQSVDKNCERSTLQALSDTNDIFQKGCCFRVRFSDMDRRDFLALGTLGVCSVSGCISPW